MSDAVPAEPVRIGHAERQAAVDALKQHHEAGRIDAMEYEDRSVRAQAARSMPELEALFTDLPQPHPVGSMLSDSASEVAASTAAGSTARGILSIPEPLATTIVSIAPILAVILFFVTSSWLWFLAIPLVAALVYGPDGRPGTGPEAAHRRKRDR